MISFRVLAVIVIATTLYLPSAFRSASSTTGPRCDGTRWDVKTLSDPAARYVQPPEKAEWKTIAEITAIQRPSKVSLKRLSLEYKTYITWGIVIGYKLESDGNFQLIVADPKDRQKTMIVEIPDPQCNGASKSIYADRYQTARSSMIHLLGSPGRDLGTPNYDVWVKITGVAFFETQTKQTGEAPNGIELHPVLSIEKN